MFAWQIIVRWLVGFLLVLLSLAHGQHSADFVVGLTRQLYFYGFFCFDFLFPNRAMNFSWKAWPHGVVALGAVGLTYMILRRAAPLGGRYRSPAPALRVATWNVAAINNNPFEYWITHDDANYNALMQVCYLS